MEIEMLSCSAAFIVIPFTRAEQGARTTTNLVQWCLEFALISKCKKELRQSWVRHAECGVAFLTCWLELHVSDILFFSLCLTLFPVNEPSIATDTYHVSGMANRRRHATLVQLNEKILYKEISDFLRNQSSFSSSNNSITFASLSTLYRASTIATSDIRSNHHLQDALLRDPRPCHGQRGRCSVHHHSLRKHHHRCL
jgi:hypothetical protein